MRIRIKYCVLATALLLSAGLIVHGARRESRTYRWSAAANLITPRSGACAATLPDGGVMISGGHGANGMLNTTEVFAASGRVTGGTPMMNARADHACATLPDGRVLVAGGSTDGGGVTNAAEVYDPATRTWTTTAPLLTARAGATASMLSDGRVLIAGGEGSGTALATLEIFNPGTNQFEAFPQAMSSPRRQHAAATLSDGRVLLAGGSDGNRPLDTVDIYDPAAGSVSSAGKLSTPRVGLSATRLLDGRVYVAGGSDGKDDLTSAEIYNPAQNSFSAAAPMTAARRGHLAVRIPNNNSILLAGGTSDGQPSPSAELYIPWWNSYRQLPALDGGRAKPAVTALKSSGEIMIAGGATASAKTALVTTLAVATISTEKSDYQPGDQVTIKGANWQAGEVVTFNITRAPNARTLQLTTTAEGSGSFIYAPTELIMTQDDANQTYTINASGNLGSTAEVYTFTDSTKLTHGGVTVGPQTPTSVNRGSQATYSIQVIFNGNSPQQGQSCTVGLSATSITGATSVFSPATLSATGSTTLTSTMVISTSSATPAVSTSFTVTVTGTGGNNNDCDNTVIQTATGTLNVSSTQTTATSLTTSLIPSVFGQSVTFTATVTPSVSGTPTGTVTFKDNGTAIGTGTLAAGKATLSTASLGVGTHPITAEYGGDSSFAPSSTPSALSQVVNQAATTTAVASSANPSVFGQQVTFTATVTAIAPGAGTPTGTVVFTVDAAAQPAVALSGSTATFSTSSLSLSSTGHTVSVAYSGDGNFTGSSNSLSQVVNKADTTTTIGNITPEPSVTGQSYQVSFNVLAKAPGAGTPTGNVTVTDGAGGSCSAAVAAGQCSLTSTSAGAKTLTAAYEGSSNFNNSSATKAHTVSKADTSTAIGTITPEPSVTGESYDVNFTVTASGPGSGTPTGNVTVTDGAGVSCSAAVSAGKCSLTSTSAGAKTLTATYGGDSNFNGSSTTAAHAVNKADTTTAVTSSANPSIFGQPVTFTATVAVSSGAGSPTGNVVFTLDNVAQSPVQLSGNTATFSTSSLGVSASGHTVSAVYIGDGNFNPSTGALAGNQVVNRADTTTSIGAISPEPSVTGQPYQVSFSVVAKAPGAGTPTGNVTVKDGNGGSCSALATEGQCWLTSTAAGTTTLTATYDGDLNFNGSSGTKQHTVNKADTTTTIAGIVPDQSVVGQPYEVSFSVSVTSPGAGTPGGEVTVGDGAGGSCSASVAIGKCSLASAAAGIKHLTAQYAGDSNFNGSQGTANHTVNKAETNTSVTPSANPSVFGQPVTFTANVAVNSPGVGHPTGSIVFTLDGVDQLPVLLSGGSATFSPATLTVAAHSVSAAYKGDDNFNVSSSGSLTQTVNKADTVTTVVSVSREPSVTGESYTVNFSVAVVSPGAGTPTGNVTVSDGTGGTCTDSLSAGKCSLASTSAGTKTLTVSYSGDSNFNSSVKTAAHTVNRADTTTTIIGVSTEPSVTGQPYEVDFSVAVVSPGAGAPTGKVTVSDGAGGACSASVAAGKCSLTSTSAGTKTLTATYEGDSNFNGSSGPKTHTVNPAPTAVSVNSSSNPSVFGQQVSFTATVTAAPPGGGTPNGGTVTFKAGATVIAASVPVSAGTAVTGAVSLLGVGSQTITAEYSGYSDYLGNTVSFIQVVNKASTTTAIGTIAPEPSIMGQSYTVSFGVTVNSPGNGTPGGTLTVSDGAGGSCTATLPATSCSLTSTSVGQKIITAAYSGDGNFNGSTGSTSHAVLYAQSGACLGQPGHSILPPIDLDGSRVFKQGSTVPAKFRVCDANGNSVGTPGVATSFTMVQTIKGVATSSSDDVPSTTPDTVFRWDPGAQQWIFNISTKTLLGNTTYVFSIGLNDGSRIPFQFGLK